MKSAGILPLPFTIGGSRIAIEVERQRAEPTLIYVIHPPLKKAGNKVLHIIGIYRCCVPDFDYEFARFQLARTSADKRNPECL